MWGSTAQISPSTVAHAEHPPGWKVTRTSYTSPGEVSACQRLRRQLRAAQQQSELMRRDAAELAASLQRKAEAPVTPQSQEVVPQLQRKPLAPQPPRAKPSGAESGHYLVPRRQENLQNVRPPKFYEAVQVEQSPVSYEVPKEAEEKDRSEGPDAQREVLVFAGASHLPASAASGPKVTGKALRVHVRCVEFESFGYTPGLFETSGFRVMMHAGRAAIRWIEGQPASARREMKYSRAVASDGRYSARLTCDFHEDLEVQVPHGHEMLSVDLWLETRSFVEQLDSLLDMVGLGNNLPEFSHIFLGRVIANLPPEDVEAVVQSYPVKVDQCEGPRPKAMSLGMCWA